MGHKCFISFKTEDENYKTEIQKWSDNNKVDMIDKSVSIQPLFWRFEQ